MLKNPNAVALGSIKSKKKALSSAENGKKGGRPKKLPAKEMPLMEGTLEALDKLTIIKSK